MTWETAQTTAEIAAAVTLVLYTIATYRLRKDTADQVKLNALIRVHEILANKYSYEIRWYLHTQFADDLANVVSDVLGEEYVNEDKSVNLDKVSGLLKNHDLLQRFNQQLRERSTTIEGVSALQAVEFALLDFDMIAMPFCLRISSLRDVAEAYKAVLERTAEKTIPFIAIERQLRGEAKYKWHYRKLLQELKIPLPKWLEVPEENDKRRWLLKFFRRILSKCFKGGKSFKAHH